MVRIYKYSKLPGHKMLHNMPDQYLQAIEYGSASFLIDTYLPSKSKAHEALKLTSFLLIYEMILNRYLISSERNTLGKGLYP